MILAEITIRYSIHKQSYVLSYSFRHFHVFRSSDIFLSVERRVNTFNLVTDAITQNSDYQTLQN